MSLFWEGLTGNLGHQPCLLVAPAAAFPESVLNPHRVECVSRSNLLRRSPVMWAALELRLSQVT